MPNGPGIYRARAKEWELGEASTGTEQIGVLFALTDPEANGDTITWFGSFTEKAAPYTLQSLRNCGWEGDNLESLDGLDANEVELVVEEQEYNGKVSLRVKYINRVGSGSLSLKSPMSPEKKRAFAARMRGQIAALDQKNGTKKPTSRTGPLSPEPPPIAESGDIPF
jgi:hypothetical protein